VYVKIWRSQVVNNAPGEVEALEQATGRPLLGRECYAPFTDVTDALARAFRSVADARGRAGARPGGTVERRPRSRAPAVVRLVPAEQRIAHDFELLSLQEQRRALRRESALLEAFEQHLAARGEMRRKRH
jgi:hypothetical protein